MLDIPQVLADQWSALPDAVRTYVAAYLGDVAVEPAAIVDDTAAPGSFADDLATGGRLLRAAFPDLVRRVVAIDVAGGRVAIRIRCEGTHDAAFFGLMTPTGRRVRFEEHHALAVASDRVVTDELAIDLRGIVRQLGARPRKQPRAAGGRRAVYANAVLASA